MSKYIVNKENEQIKPYNELTGKEKETVDETLPSNEKKKEAIQPIYIKEEKSKVSFSPLKIEENKKNINLKSLIATEEKGKVSFSPLKIEETKNNLNIKALGVTEEKVKVTTYAEFKEKKVSEELDQVKQTERKNSKPISFVNKEEKKSNINIDQNYDIRYKTKESIKGELPLISKTKGDDLFKSQIIYSKDELPISAEFTEKKSDENIEYIPEFQQKESPELFAESEISKEDFEIKNNGGLENKEDASLDNIEKLARRETIDIITESILENKEDFGLSDNLTLENKQEIELIGAKIDQLMESEDPKRDVYAKERVKGIFKIVSGAMSAISLGMEGDLARALMMPYETDATFSKMKSIKSVLGKGGAAGVIGGISGVGSMVSEGAQKLKYMSTGEIIAYYTADFYTLSASKPSPAIKTPGSSFVSLLTGGDYHGQILLGEGDGTGEIGSSVFGNILGKISFYSNVENLKSFGINMIKNFALGRLFGSLENQQGNVQANKKKEENQVKVDPFQTEEKSIGVPNGQDALAQARMGQGGYGSTNSVKFYNFGEYTGSLYQNPKERKASSLYIKEGDEKVDYREADLKYGEIFGPDGEVEEQYYKINDVFNDLKVGKNILKQSKENAIDIQLEAGDQYSVPHFNFESERNKNKGNLSNLNLSLRETFNSRDIRSGYNLGYMLVQPVAEKGSQQDFPVFKIEFQFNPEISEGAQSAVYNPTTILNRIGELYSYAGTGAMKPNLTLKYRVLSNNSIKGNDWMSKWTLPYIQKIEMALRSLVVPSSIEGNTRSTRPPVIRVNLGKNSNLFQFKIMKNQSQKYRYFVASSVEINKNYDNKGYYIGKTDEREGFEAFDTMGFNATLQLIEVKRSYYTMFPNFNDYYESVTADENNLSYFMTGEGF